MGEAPAGGEGRAKWERAIVQRSLQDEAFRQRLLDEPKGTLEQELGSALPQGAEVRVVEESSDTIYLVLPSASAIGQGVELSDQDLEAVAGGVGGKNTDNDVTCGRACNTDICTSLSC
jgi:hypothetical protein